jgi:hypothetical protein
MRLLSSLLLLLVTAAHGYAWGEQGHRVIANVAEHRLSSPRAKREVAALLKPGETLADASLWADQIRGQRRDAEAQAFIKRHPRHGDYHYVNLPFQVQQYRDDAPGTRPDDIVRITETAILALQGKSDAFTRREALLMLVHHASDMHMPLHLGSGYVAEVGGRLRFVNPAAGQEGVGDRGGNSLRFSPLVPGGRNNLHAFWDGDAVRRAQGDATAEEYALRLVRYVPVESAWKGTGDPAAWPRQWTRDILWWSRLAYRDVELLRERTGRTQEWDVRLPDGYLEMSGLAARYQMAKAGYRLAAVLDAIWP